MNTKFQLNNDSIIEYISGVWIPFICKYPSCFYFLFYIVTSTVRVISVFQHFAIHLEGRLSKKFKLSLLVK